MALTANVLKDKEEYRQKGMDAAISKPLSVAAVREVIAKMTQHHAGESVAKVKSNKEKELPDVSISSYWISRCCNPMLRLSVANP